MRYATLLVIASGLLQPPGLLLLIGALGWLLDVAGWRYVGRTLLLVAIGSFYLLSTAIGTRSLVFPLEDRYPPLHALATGVGAPEAIVVLGGGEIIAAPDQGGDAVNARTLMRLQGAARLAPTGLPIVVSGGAPRYQAATEAATMEAVLRGEFHVSNPIWQEGRSYNTAANAFDTAALLARHHIRRVYLVTSALHMPRAAAWFRRAGLDVVPVPVDYRLDRAPAGPLSAWLPRAVYLEVSSEAMHEYLGLFWLWLQGETGGRGV